MPITEELSTSQVVDSSWLIYAHSRLEQLAKLPEEQRLDLRDTFFAGACMMLSILTEACGKLDEAEVDDLVAAMWRELEDSGDTWHVKGLRCD
jgi:hypothetical protein